MKQAILITAFLFSQSLVSAQQIVPEIDMLVSVFAESPKLNSSAIVRQKFQIAAGKRQISTAHRGRIDKTLATVTIARNQYFFPSLREKKNEIAVLESIVEKKTNRLKELEKNDAVAWPEFSLKLGFGFPKNGVYVWQVVNKNEALIGSGGNLLLRGVSTAGMSDEKTYQLDQVLVKTGTYGYRTVLGDMRTVPVFEPVDTDAVNKKYREWKELQK